MRSVIVILMLSASVADADIATWFWTVTDTGDGDGLIEPGEAAVLTLSVAFTPEASGVSEAGPYGIVGNARWGEGVVEDRRNLLDNLALGDGTLNDTTNAISDIHHFQLSPFFNMNFNSNNPIALYAIRWAPDHYSTGTVTLESGAPDAWIYIGFFGDRRLYEGAGGTGAFTIIPAPATAVPVALSLASWRRRRRG